MHLLPTQRQGVLRTRGQGRGHSEALLGPVPGRVRRGPHCAVPWEQPQLAMSAFGQGRFCHKTGGPEVWTCWGVGAYGAGLETSSSSQLRSGFLESVWVQVPAMPVGAGAERPAGAGPWRCRCLP